MEHHMVRKPLGRDQRAQRGLHRPTAKQVQSHLGIGVPCHQGRNRLHDGVDVVVGFPGAQAHDLQAGLAGPGGRCKARQVHAPVDFLHRAGRAIGRGRVDQALRVARDQIGPAQAPAREPAHQGIRLGRHQQVAAPGRHHQRLAAAARCQVAVGGDVVRMHDVGRQRLHMALRLPHAKQPIGRAVHGRKDFLLHPVHRCRPRCHQ